MLKLIITLLVFGYHSFGQSQIIVHEDCDDISLEPIEETECVLRNLSVTQHLLDSLYDEALKYITYIHINGRIDTDMVAKTALVKSQESWEKYRRDETEVIRAIYDKGTYAKTAAWRYRTKMNLDRIREFVFIIHSKLHIARPDWNIALSSE